MIKKYALLGAAALAFSAAPALAAPLITSFVPVFGVPTAAFGNLDPVTGSAVHTDTYTFSTASAGDIFAQVGSVGLKLLGTNLDFTSVTLNNIAFNISSTGIVESRSLFTPSTFPTDNTLVVSYKNAQAFATYGGTLSFFAAAAPAVPEPATWGMMILGFGMMGAAMRYRRSATKVRFA